MEYFLAPLGQDFNKIYADVVNSSIIAPPHYSGRVPHTFFFTKRGGFTEYPDTETFDLIYDIVESGNDIYYIGKQGNQIIVRKNATAIYTGTYVDGVNYKFYYINSAKGTLLESGTGANGVTVGSDVVIRDTTATWTSNEFAGKFVYVYEADAGTGQIMSIDRNDGTDLYVTQTGWKVAPTNAKYYIFSDFGDTLSFVGPDNCYIIHNDTSVVKIKSVSNPIDAVYWNGRNYIVDSNKKIYVSAEGGVFANYFNQRSLIGAVDDVVNIIDFRDFVLLLGQTKISIIRSSDKVITNLSGASEIITTFSIVTATNQVGILAQNAFRIYNNGLYILSTFKQFLSVNIESVGIDKFTVTTQNNGIYIQKFLDTLSTGDDISISITDQNIYIIVNNGDFTNLYIYDYIYLGWYRWTTNLAISGYKGQKFFGTKIYTISTTSFLDNGVDTYDQNIKMIVGEENIFNMKRSLLAKFYITRNTSLESEVTFTSQAGGNVDSYTKSLRDLGYLQFAAGVYSGVSDTLGSNILGYGLIGSQKLSLASIIADICNIEIPTGFFYELLIIEIKGEGLNKVEFGGMMSGYTLFEPQVTSIKNVI